MLKPGIRHVPRVSRVTGRRAPNEYSEAVEMWARNNGGHAKLKWLPDPMNCWAVILSYRVGDPRQGTDSDGEPVLLHEYWTAKEWEKNKPTQARRHPRYNTVMPGNYAFDLDELGVAGLIERLDKGNILSGRGEFTSVEQAADVQRQKHKSDMDKMVLGKMDNARFRALDMRRSAYKIPFLKVGVEFTKDGAIKTSQPKESNPV